jgi:hypothetical protein
MLCAACRCRCSGRHRRVGVRARPRRPRSPAEHVRRCVYSRAQVVNIRAHAKVCAWCSSLLYSRLPWYHADRIKYCCLRNMMSNACATCQSSQPYTQLTPHTIMMLLYSGTALYLLCRSAGCQTSGSSAGLIQSPAAGLAEKAPGCNTRGSSRRGWQHRKHTVANVITR